MNTVYLSLGANQGDRPGNLRRALKEIARLPRSRLVTTSSVYETDPILPPGAPPQDDFLNLVAEIETDLSPPDLLAALLAIESRLGRVRREKNDPRPIDIDILFYGTLVLARGDLVIPHPRIPERRFVLEPLSELAPRFTHPAENKTIAELLQSAPRNQRVQKSSLNQEGKQR